MHENVKINNLPEANASSLPRWRGFNLLEKSSVDHAAPFLGDDFRWISELGFNFVRLPMDYRCWINNNDWNSINEDVLKEIDQAVSWGRQYNIHVCLNFHRAPGYCIVNPDMFDLWTDPEVQRVCARHWALFAKRYAGIPNKHLSFNLLNEPFATSNQRYMHVVQILADAIRREDPARLIIADGVFIGMKPAPELAGLGVAQSTRGYLPWGVSQYHASWIDGADRMPRPQWPYPLIPGYLYGPAKPELAGPLRIKGDFSEKTALRLHVQVVSDFVQLLVRADGREICSWLLRSGSGKGEWKESIYNEEYGIYQNVFDRDYVIDLPAQTGEIEIEAIQGDWLSFSELTFTPQDPCYEQTRIINPTVPYWGYWGIKQTGLFIEKNGDVKTREDACIDRAWLRREYIEPWLDLQRNGVGVMVGEWGAYDKTPHDVALSWMRDCLENWREAGWGWVLWNFRGSFGPLDSNRVDVKYEDFHGHQLDRKMLTLLEEY